MTRTTGRAERSWAAVWAGMKRTNKKANSKINFRGEMKADIAFTSF
jgi:hypothetical protein